MTTKIFVSTLILALFTCAAAEAGPVRNFFAKRQPVRKVVKSAPVRGCANGVCR